MGEVKRIAKTVAEAQVGEWLWRIDPDAPRYEGGKYQGRGTYTLVEVTEVIRISLVAGRRKYDRKTGATRPRSNYGSGGPRLGGSEERIADWWNGKGYALAEKIRHCRDVETLKAVAFVLGIEGPPDFSADPDAPGRAAIASMETVEGGGEHG